MTTHLMADVDAGLSSTPKTLPSKYFYDAAGDELFQRIMQLPEYYLTRAELAIFRDRTDPLIAALKVTTQTHFELIELGAGDGTKTLHLLRRLLERGFDFDYLPIDISENALEQLQSMLNTSLPSLSVQPQHGDYFKILGTLKKDHQPKVVLFLGSNIGNMRDEVAADFLKALSEQLNEGDRLLLGVDLIKADELVLPAYNDSRGITSQFNLNLLCRINAELDADFQLDQFEHLPQYDEAEGIARSFLRSLTQQSVTIAALGKTYHFAAGETIQTEISRKYNDRIIQQLIADTGLRQCDKLTDQEGLFADYILEKKPPQD